MLRKMTFLLWLLSFFSLFLAASSLAGGFATSGVGSKAVGMGGAFRGLADDWSAVYWNPAGLAQLQSSVVNITVAATSHRGEYTPNIKLGEGSYLYEIGFKNGTRWFHKDEINVFPDAGGFLKLPGVQGVAAGVGIFMNYDLNFRWDLFDPPVGYNNTVEYPEVDHSSKLRVIDFHPSIAKEVMENKLFLGAGFSVQYCETNLRRTEITPNLQLDPVTGDTIWLPRPLDHLYTDVLFEGDGWGYGFNAGLLFKLNPKFQIGASYRSATTVKLEGDTKLDLYLPQNAGMEQYFLDRGTAADTLTAELFKGGLLSSKPDAKLDLKLPADVGVGIAYIPNDKLTLTADVNYTQWDQLELLELKLEGTSPMGNSADTIAIVTNWENTVRFSTGLQYVFNETVTLRGGYYYDPSPVPDETLSPLFPDIGDKNSFNFGGSLFFGDYEVSYNFEYISSWDRDIDTLSDPNGDGLFDNYTGSYKMNSLSSLFSLTYRF
jgi:long-chain fatty acid transport protein